MNHIATTVMSMAAKGADDIGEVKWFRIDKLSASEIVDTHQVLYTMMVRFLESKFKITKEKANAGTAKA